MDIKLKKVELDELENWIEVYTLIEFTELVKMNVITREDGGGNFGTSEGYSEEHKVFYSKRPDWATHVYWFSK